MKMGELSAGSKIRLCRNSPPTVAPWRDMGTKPPPLHTMEVRREVADRFEDGYL